MSTGGPLNDRPKAELATLARRRGIRGWESMSKGDLVKALSRAAPAKAGTKVLAKPSKPVRTAIPTKPTKPAKPVAARVVKAPKPLPKPAAKSAAKVTRPAPARPLPTQRIAPAPAVNGTGKPAAPSANGLPRPAAKPASAPPAKPPAGKTATPAKPAAAREAAKEPAPRTPSSGLTKDRIFLAVPEPHWLHVIWELSAQSIQRAEAALKQDWYGAKLIIRLSDVTSHDTTSTSETPLRDIVVEGECTTWYINVPQPPRQYRADIGYLSRRGDFFPLAKSNVATPPKAGSSEALDAWPQDAKQAERTLARSTGFASSGDAGLREFIEERLKRSLAPPRETAFGSGATPPGAMKKFFFNIDAGLIVCGWTDPSAHVTLGNDPVSLKPDGSFAMWFSLPDSRQIIPAVATSADGVEERTIVLAVERNTKYLDPMIHDQMNEI